MSKIILTYYEAGGECWPDGELEGNAEYWCDILKKQDRDIEKNISQENIITAFRLMVVRKVIRPEQLIIKFKDKTITVNEWGTLSEYPGELGCEIINFTSEILRGNVKLRESMKKDLKTYE